MIDATFRFSVEFPAEDEPEPHPDIVIGCCGYESRSVFLPIRHSGARHKAAVDMKSNGLVDYDENRKAFISSGFQLFDSAPESVAAAIDRIPRERPASSSRPISVLLDISSMTRRVAADAIVSLVRSGKPGDTIDIVYAFSDYVPPPDSMAPVVYSGPANAEMAGSILDSSLPVALVVGLGSEPGRAIGCVDRLEARDVFAFIPRGIDPRFERDVSLVNADVLDIAGGVQTLSYRVDQPADIFQKLSSLISGLEVGRRVVIVPFGPKIFAVSAMVVALLRQGRVSVWRVSGDSTEIPVNRKATGHLSRFRLRL